MQELDYWVDQEHMDELGRHQELYVYICGLV